MSTDLGQAENAIHSMGFKVFIVELMKADITKEEIDRPARINLTRALDVARERMAGPAH